MNKINKKILDWLFDERYSYPFWHPQSGFWGGVIMGLIFVVIYFLFVLLNVLGRV